MMTRFALAAAALIALPLSAQAQDVSLSSGFLPDPMTFNIPAGGPTDVSEHVDGCVGYVADEPDLSLTYESAGGPLTFYVTSDADTTLVINGPDGEFYCNDDSDGLNPAVRFDSAASGVYDVFIGTYLDGEYPPSTLHISEY